MNGDFKFPGGMKKESFMSMARDYVSMHGAQWFWQFVKNDEDLLVFAREWLSFQKGYETPTTEQVELLIDAVWAVLGRQD